MAGVRCLRPTARHGRAAGPFARPSQSQPADGSEGETPLLSLTPMLHSKVYSFNRTDGTSAAFVGSHSLTGFALCGLNGEAGVFMEGTGHAAPSADIRQHISSAVSVSVQSDPTLRDAYA